MTAESPIVIVLDRELSADDQKAVNRLMAQWLVYDVKIRRSRASAEIKLFHTIGAKPHLTEELGRLFPKVTIVGA